MLKNASREKYEENKTEMLKISLLSKKVLSNLMQTESLNGTDFDWQSHGTLQLFRTQAQLEAARSDIKILHASGVNARLLTDLSGIQEKEKGLESAISKGEITGAIYLPDDETGDCHKFTQILAEKLSKKGVKFLYSTTPEITQNGKKFSVKLSALKEEQFDAIVVCAGVQSPQILKKLGVEHSYNIYPVKGYSLTFESQTGPSSTVMDETHKIAITRLGSRIRMGGVAELNGFNSDLDEDRRQQFISVFESLYGSSESARSGLFWTGLRPSTPSSVPYIEKVQGQNSALYINAGHGTLGWTMACASGYLLAAQIWEDFK